LLLIGPSDSIVAFHEREAALAEVQAAEADDEDDDEATPLLGSG
jgi:hypothetical protein